MASALAPRMLCVAMLAAVLLAASARAEPPAAEEQLPAKPLAEKVLLEDERGPGAESCPSEQVVRHAILSRMKVDPFSPTAKAKLRVRIVSVGGMFQASYEIIDSDGVVVLPITLPKHEKCGVAVEDVAFSVGLHLPMLITGPVPSASAEKSAAAPVCSSPPVPACEEPPPSKPPPVAEKPATGWRLDASVLMSIQSSVASVVPGFSVDFGRSWQFFSVSAGLRYEFPGSDGGKLVNLTTWRTLGELVPCVHTTTNFKSFNVFVCGLLQVGGLGWKGKTLDQLKTGDEWIALAGARGGFEIGFPFADRVPVLSRFAFLVAVDVSAVVLRPKIQMGHQEIDWRPPYFPTAVAGGVRVLF